MASTVPTGTITSWLILEETWSPYRLEGDLTVASNTRMTVNDGVELRIASNAIIDVQGIFEAEQQPSLQQDLALVGVD